MLTTKAQAIRIASNFSEQLWPEAMQAAVYLANCFFTSSLVWASPIEVLSKAVNLPHLWPYLDNLQVYSAKAYARIQEARRLWKEKLQEHTLIDYLVGNNSTDIFHIWILSELSVITTRNVTSDKSLFYELQEPGPQLFCLSMLRRS